MSAVDAMSQEEATAATAFEIVLREAIDRSMRDSPRSTYAAENKIGVSDIGGCREFVRRTIIDEAFTDEQENYAAAFVGTAVGALAEQAMKDALGDQVETQVAVTVTLNIRGYVLNLPGHPDLVSKDACVDFKTVDKLGVTRRTGPTTKQWYQVHLYVAALIAMGRLPKDAWCILAFIDRSGSEPQPLVFARRFDPAIVREAEDWLDDVIYAVQHDEETSRDQPRSWCEAVCPRVSACRGYDTDVTGLIEDPVVLEAIEVYREATAAIKQLEKDKDSAKSVLRDIAGNTGDTVIRWIEVPESEVPAHKRAGYRRISFSKPPRPPRKRAATAEEPTEGAT
jgi:hypothetical protein